MDEAKNNHKYEYGKRPLWYWIVVYVVIGAIIYGIVYYFVFPKQNGNSYTTPMTNNDSSSTQQQSLATAEFTISGNEFAFTPADITVKKGQPVKITFNNTGKFPHNYVISELNLQTKIIQSGESDSITFTPDKTGTFDFICSVPGHADRGMKGTFTVQ